MIRLEKLLTYANNVYQVGEQINSLRRKNLKSKIKASTGVKTVFTGIMCQNRSINEMIETVHEVKNLKNIYAPREVEPKTHGLRDCLIDTPYEQVRKINENIIKKVKENKFFRKNKIDGLTVIAADGVEEFETNKQIEGLAERNHKDGIKTRYYKALGLMNVGEKTQIMLGLEELKAKESERIIEKIEEENKGKKISEERLKEKIKAEGEVTVLKRIIPEIRKKVGREIDVIVLDALYANVPILNCVKENKLETVIRFKEERRDIYKDAMGMFEKRKADLEYEIVEKKISIKIKYNKNSHKKNKQKNKYERIERNITENEIGRTKEVSRNTSNKGKSKREIKETEKIIKRVEVWSDEFELRNYEYGKVRFIRYEEKLPNGKHQTIFLITTLLKQDLRTILKIMHSRWLIENNGFRVLKDRYNLDHCYVGELNAIRLINEIIMLVYNLMNLYINVRTKEFRESRKTIKILKKIFERQISENKKIYILFCDIEKEIIKE